LVGRPETGEPEVARRARGSRLDRSYSIAAATTATALTSWPPPRCIDSIDGTDCLHDGSKAPSARHQEVDVSNTNHNRILRAAARVGLVRIEIAALARRAGVSEAVARRVVRGDRAVSEDATRRVLDALGLPYRA
jgi:hypothetical protein